MSKVISFLALLFIFFGIGYALVWAIAEGEPVKIIVASIVSGIILFIVKDNWWQLWD